MHGIVDLQWFLLAGLALNLTPGPDFTYIAGWSLRRGVRAGVVAALGIGAGCLVHVAAAALGLSALLAASPQAMTMIRFAGGLYLVWLGVMMIVQTMRASDAAADDRRAGPPRVDGAGTGVDAPGAGRPEAGLRRSDAVPLPPNAPASAALSVRAPLRRIFAQGMLTNVLNPKVALFFLAFLPQFVDPAAPAATKVVALALLGATFTFNGTLCCIGVAWAAGRLGERLRGTRAARWLTGVLGSLLAMFGLRLIV